MPKKLKLGDILVEQGIITEEQLAYALKEQKKYGAKLGKTLIELKLVEESALLNCLSTQLDIPFINLKNFKFKEKITRLVPERIARRFRVILLDKHEGAFFVGMVDPLDLVATDELSRFLQGNIRLALVREEELLRSIDLIYRRTEEITGFAEELSADLEVDLGEAALLSGQDEEVPVAKLLKSLFEDAVQVGASDVHIEPDEKVLRIRLRVDGVLHEQMVENYLIANALTQRLKLMAGLDISEKRFPQDGRFHVNVRNLKLDVRMSTMPIQYGESVVLRLLDQANVNAFGIDALGMDDHLRRRVLAQLEMSQNMMLVVGPTGSGKTTTLYALLSHINSAERKIITVEDPIEYYLPRLNQVQVHGKIGLDFPILLRSVLRQDPDVIMVGEIRDQATANITLRAALTGNLVFATLHTSNTVNSIYRLIDMGMPGFLIAAAVRSVLAQRLVRRICEGCKEKATLTR